MAMVLYDHHSDYYIRYSRRPSANFKLIKICIHGRKVTPCGGHQSPTLEQVECKIAKEGPVIHGQVPGSPLLVRLQLAPVLCPRPMRRVAFYHRLFPSPVLPIEEHESKKATLERCTRKPARARSQRHRRSIDAASPDASSRLGKPLSSPACAVLCKDASLHLFLSLFSMTRRCPQFYACRRHKTGSF